MTLETFVRSFPLKKHLQVDSEAVDTWPSEMQFPQNDLFSFSYYHDLMLKKRGFPRNAPTYVSVIRTTSSLDSSNQLLIELCTSIYRII